MSKGTTPAKQILVRLETQKWLKPFKATVHGRRLLVAGDYSSIDAEAPSQKDNSGDPANDLKMFYDVVIRDTEEGSSNILLQGVRTLLLQTVHQAPDVQFEDLSAEESAVNQQYISKRLGAPPIGCGALDHQKMALLDYIISSVGWTWCGLRNRKPAVMVVDTLDVSWDQSATLLPNIRWVSVVVRQPVGYWIECYPETKARLTEHLSLNPEIGLERIIEMEMYWDLDGESGTEAMFLKTGWESFDQEPVYVKDNPHYFMLDEERIPFLPIEPLYFLQLPSVRHTTSLAELALPNQLSLRNAMRYQNLVVDRGQPFYDVEADAYDDDNLEKMEGQSDIGMVIIRKSGQKPVTKIEGLEIPESVNTVYEVQKQETVSNLGVNPYSSGNKVDGINYAAEVNAIESAASLIAATVAKDHSAHWQRVISKCLANGAAYDDRPIEFHMDGVLMRFDKSDPIKDYLRADAVVSIAEDTMQYRSRDAKVQRAASNIEICSAPGIVAKFPKALDKAFEMYLRALGVQNVAEWMEQPVAPPAGVQTAGQAPPMPGPGGPPMGGPGPMPMMAPGGMSPAGTAAAATV